MEPIGKRVGLHLYFHVDRLDESDTETAERVRAASDAVGVRPGADFNVAKLERDGGAVSLLDYPDFFDAAFPLLRRAWTVDLAASTVRFRTSPSP